MLEPLSRCRNPLFLEFGVVLIFESRPRICLHLTYYLTAMVLSPDGTR